jgi:outer membrane receptor protein involved in Fe transport
MDRRSLSPLLALLLTLAVAAPALGQGAGRAEISGTIIDQQNAVLPGVTVTVTEENTGLSRNTVTSANGDYVVPTLLPGRYTISAELSGFQKATRSGIPLGVGQELTIDLTLRLQGVQETITVTGGAPLIEVTASRVGSNIGSTEIDELPSAGRSQLSLMQLIPGLTPSLSPGTFEGGQFNANGRETTSNLFLVDGVYNNDDRRGGSQANQARVTLDTMAEYQVLTHQYTAEYGGASGVVVNAVTRSGTNQFSGRVFSYFQDESLNATNYFVEQEGGESPEAGSKIAGASLGGPLVRNKAFWFTNIERNLTSEAANLIYPPQAAPLATSYSGSTDIDAWNTFVRSDYQVTDNQHLSFRWVRERAITDGEDLQDDLSIPENKSNEHDTDQIVSLSWMSVLGSRATNEVKISHVRENLLQGSVAYFDDDLNFVPLGNRDPWQFGSNNEHPDFSAGTSAGYQEDRIRTYGIENTFTYVHAGRGGDHTVKVGGGWSRNSADPQIVGGNLNGSFEFLSNRPFNPTDPFTYPSRFQIRLGRTSFVQEDWRTNVFVQDKWQAFPRVTFNLGVRYDYQDLTPLTKNAFAPRVGVAVDATGSGRTVVRGGFGKFYEYQPISTIATLLQDQVISQAYIFDTGEDESADEGMVPSHVCLQPSNNAGRAVMSPACRALLGNVRSQVNAGGFVNTDPTIDGDRRLGYLWGFSAGIEQQLGNDLAVAADYVGNRGRDQTGLIDINEPINGVRPGVDVFDPSGALVPAQARDAMFRQFLQFQTRDDFNSDYNALELSVEKRRSDRWSGRMAYTLARSRDVGTGGVNARRVVDDHNPRADYGRSNFDNRHAIAFAANLDIWKGLGAGLVGRYYTGSPINETVGSDVNDDLDNNDRPIRGIHDAAMPIVSPVDASGRAVRNGIDGEKQFIIDARAQYLWRVATRQQVGLFLEIYNLTDEVNFGNPTGNRRSRNFLVPVAANTPRTLQLGVRYSF